MKTRRLTKKDRYCITIASQTSAHKNARVINTTRASIITAITAMMMAVLFSIGAAVWTTLQVNRYQTEADALTDTVNKQAALIDSCEGRLDLLKQAEKFREINEALGAEESAPATDSSVLAEDAKSASSQTATEDSVLAMPVRDAVVQINEDFVAGMDKQVSVAKLGTPADEVGIEYSGDIEGDSNTVNNWADVLAIFVVESGYDIKTLVSITEEDCGRLEKIYDDMNQITVGTATSTVKYDPSAKEAAAPTPEEEALPNDETAVPSADAADTPTVGGTGESPAGEAEEAYRVKLTVTITINSMDCYEYADQCGFDNDKMDALDDLMDPDYNMTFAALLGVDLYDGLNSEQLAQIISELEPGRIGTTIVQAALTRVGDPYSKGRRGSGNYVDCSYFAYWAYSQAGITIPTSSVEQAKYCQFNGYRISIDELQPGDLLFWQKTTCHCGRWHEIHHAGVYAGNGMVVEASSCKGRVVIRKLWSGAEWRLFMAARPYVEQTPEAAATPAAGAGME